MLAIPYTYSLLYITVYVYSVDSYAMNVNMYVWGRPCKNAYL